MFRGLDALNLDKIYQMYIHRVDRYLSGEYLTIQPTSVLLPLAWSPIR